MTSQVLKSLVLLIILCFVSCSDSNEPIDTMICPNDALHTIDNAPGSMIYISCYDAWGVLLDNAINEEERTIGASLSVPEEYHIEGLKVQLDACFYEFDLPLLFPDPGFWGTLYNMENIRLIEE